MSIVKVNFFSESLLRTVNFVAIIPIDKRSVDGNMLRGKEPFKAMYLLHGVYGSEYDWITSTCIRQWAQDWNLAVFMPAGENKFYNDNEASHDLFGKFIGEELVNFTRTMFRLSEKREDTYVAGLSMGGLGAILTGLRYPETFSHIGAFSSGLITDQYPKDDTSSRAIQRRSFYESVCGAEKDYAGSRNDYISLAKELKESGRLLPRIYMACGTEDFLLESNRKYRDHLKKLGYELEYHEEAGGHEWGFWNQQVYQFLQTLPLEEMSPSLSSGHVM